MINQHEQPAPSLLLPRPARRPARVAFQLGLIFGGVCAALTLLRYLFMQFFVTQALLFLHIRFSIISTWFTYSSLLMFILIFFGAAVLASKQTGQVTTGIFADLWIFLWSFVAGIITNAISYLLILSHFPSSLIQEILHSIFSYEMFSSMLSLSVGAILGVLGGVLGRWLWRQQNIRGNV